MSATKESSGSGLAALLPLGLGAVILALIVVVGPHNILPTSLPPAEDLHVDRVLVQPHGFTLEVVNAGGVDLTIAQVLVDEAYWDHTVSPARTLAPLGSATITVPFGWVEGEAYAIGILTGTGTRFETEVALAIAAPERDGSFFGRFTLVGILVGVLPVALGMSFRPWILRGSVRVERFVLALTVGLLAFLALDGVVEGLELSHEVASIYNPQAVLVLGAAAAFLIVWGMDRLLARRQAGVGPGTGATGLRLAWLVAFGIGLHNLGEGLAIGAAWAAGSVAFGTFLVLGFTIHNVTEGPAIIAPAARARISAGTWIGLLALAGLPTILGGWIGGASPSPLLVVTFLGLGIGAIAVVAVQVAGHLRREDAKALSASETVWGLLAGFAIMWATGLLVAV